MPFFYIQSGSGVVLLQSSFALQSMDAVEEDMSVVGLNEEDTDKRVGKRQMISYSAP